MPLKALYRYMFAGTLFLYAGIQIWTGFIAPPEIGLLSNESWLFGFAGWFVIVFSLLFMSPSLIVIWFALRVEQDNELVTYHKEAIEGKEFIPDAIHKWESDLRLYGFSFLGMYRGTHTSQEENNYRAWVYVNKARDVYADIVVFENGTNAIEFSTEFADGFQLGTLYNLALNVDSDIFYCRSFKGSIGEAHAYHVYQVDLRSEAHGEILQPETVAEYLHSPERTLKLNRAINASVLRDNFNVIRAYSYYLAPPIIAMLLAFVIPLVYADILFAIGTGLVFIFVDVTGLKMSYVTVDDARKATG